ncbi:MAG: thermostable hemolysin [Phaeobacter gallaeciensis]
MRIEFLTPTSPGRKAAEAHIRDVYDTTYAAQVKGFAPVLAAASNAEGKILCAAGIRTALSAATSTEKPASAVVESRPCVASRASLVDPPFGFSNRRLDAAKENPSTANAVPAIVAPPPSRSAIE